MYESFYHLSGKPFQLSPDPKFYFSSRGHKRAMTYLEYGVHQGDGFIVITGEVGAGKTMLARTLLRKLESRNLVAAQIVSTQIGADDLVRLVLAAFGLPYENDNKVIMLKTLEHFLAIRRAHGKRALLIVDEAQNLPAPSLEELRMLSNFQTGDRPLLQSFLLGQPEFRNIMQGPNMHQFRQRVIASCHLGPMEPDEVGPYVQHRLRTVGWDGDPAFTDGAFTTIFEFTEGVPRRINMICDRLMLMGHLEEKHDITVELVNEVIQDMQREEFPAPVRMMS